MIGSPKVTEGISPARRRRIIQLVFIFVNLALVEVHLPGPLWVAIGGIFWIGLVGVTLAGSNLVCGTMCWIGAIQDIFEPMARNRVRLDARVSRAMTLGVLAIWMPVGWIVMPGLAAHDRMPIDLSLAFERHLFQFVLAALVAISVIFLGKRGICRFLCPFNSIVATVRRALTSERRSAIEATAPHVPITACASACSGCSRREPPSALQGSLS